MRMSFLVDFMKQLNINVDVNVDKHLMCVCVWSVHCCKNAFFSTVLWPRYQWWCCCWYWAI